MSSTTDIHTPDLSANFNFEEKQYSDCKVVPARYPLRMLGTVFSVLVIGAILYSVFTNEKWGWSVFATWFLSEPVLAGLGRTILLTILATIAGSLLGTCLALARVSKSPLLSGLSWSYIWLLRSVPLIVLLLILNNLGYLYESVRLTNPLNGEVLVNYPKSFGAEFCLSITVSMRPPLPSVCRKNAKSCA